MLYDNLEYKVDASPIRDTAKSVGGRCVNGATMGSKPMELGSQTVGIQ